MTRPKMKMKKGFRSVAKTTTLGRALNLIDQTRPLPKKKEDLLKHEIKENDIIVILLMDIVLE